VLGKYDRLTKIAEQLAQLQPSRENLPAYVEAVARTAMQLFNMGWARHGDALLARVAPAQQSLAESHPAAVAWIHHARAFGRLYGVGDPGGYLAHCEAAAKQFEAAGDLRRVANARVHLGFAYLEVGGYREAELALRDALSAAERMGLHNVVATSKHNLGMALARLGMLDEAAQVEDEAVRLSVAQRDSRIEGASRHYLAGIQLLRGDYEQAENEALAAAEMLRVAPPSRAHALATVAQIRLAQGRRQEALHVAEEAMTLLESLGAIEEGETTVRMVHSHALYENGRVEEARAAIQIAVRRLHDRAAKIADPRWRDSFLTRVPDNALTLSLARQWQVPATFVAPSSTMPPTSSRPPN
jgi:tetratricopeptide (TPR) repeat protein